MVDCIIPDGGISNFHCLSQIDFCRIRCAFLSHNTQCPVRIPGNTQIIIVISCYPVILHIIVK